MHIFIYIYIYIFSYIYRYTHIHVYICIYTYTPYILTENVQKHRWIGTYIHGKYEIFTHMLFMYIYRSIYHGDLHRSLLECFNINFEIYFHRKIEFQATNQFWSGGKTCTNAVCLCVAQCVAVCCSVFQQIWASRDDLHQYSVAVCCTNSWECRKDLHQCSVLHIVAVCCNVSWR